MEQYALLFNQKALVVGRGHWAVYGIDAVEESDEGVTSLWLSDDDHTVELILPMSDVTAILNAGEVDWVETACSRAFAAYEQSDREERDWDTFKVTVQLSL